MKPLTWLLRFLPLPPHSGSLAPLFIYSIVCLSISMSAFSNMFTRNGREAARQPSDRRTPTGSPTRKIVETYEMLGSLHLETRQQIPQFQRQERGQYTPIQRAEHTVQTSFLSFRPFTRFDSKPPIQANSSQAVFLEQSYHTVPTALQPQAQSLLAFQRDRAADFRTNSQSPPRGRTVHQAYAASRTSRSPARHAIVATFEVCITPAQAGQPAKVAGRMTGIRCELDSATWIGQ